MSRKGLDVMTMMIAPLALDVNAVPAPVHSFVQPSPRGSDA